MCWTRLAFFSASLHAGAQKPLQNHEALPWKKAWKHYSCKSSPICPVGWVFGECKYFGHSIYASQPLPLHETPPSSPAAENHAGAHGPPPLYPILSGPQKDTGASSICPVSPPRELAFIRVVRSTVYLHRLIRDAFNCQCQTLQYCHPQNPLFLLSQIRGMKNHQADAFEHLSDSQVHSNTAISWSISLSFTVLQSIGTERLWAWFCG